MTSSPLNVRILDGGTGHELKRRLAGTFTDAALANSSFPDAVQCLHAEYISAGADVVTTNTFAVTPWHLNRVLDAHDAEASVEGLAAAAGQLARQAVDSEATRRGVRVAGCLPPLRDCYASEDWLVGDGAAANEARDTYSTLVAALAPSCDLFVVETASYASQACMAARAAAQGCAPGTELWVSWTLADSLHAGPRLRGGQALADACQDVILSGVQVDGWLVNCCSPHIAASDATWSKLHEAASNSGARLVGCSPNAFKTTTSQWLDGGGAADAATSWAPDPDFDSTDSPPSWRPHCFGTWGAALIEQEMKRCHHARSVALGGCCGTTPAHIAALSAALSHHTFNAISQQ